MMAMQSKKYRNHVAKYVHEYEFWKKFTREHVFDKGYYEPLFTECFGLDKTFYDKKRIVDIGCGPIGSLEWADNALERVGIDPLAEAYEYLGTTKHRMSYQPDFVENISFTDNYFDVGASMNSLDHVDDLEKCIQEIVRIIKPGGLFLLIVDISPIPRPCEPTPLSWALTSKFAPVFKVLDERHLESKSIGGCGGAVKSGQLFDHNDSTERIGAMAVKFQKVGD